MKIKYHFLLVVFAGLLVAYGQNTSPPTQPEKLPEISKDLHVAFRDDQHKIDGYNTQFNQLKDYATKLQAQAAEVNTDLDKLEDRAFTESKVSKNDYTFDRESLTFSKKPALPATLATPDKPAAAPTKPAAKGAK
jgi:hypothetical protein